MRFTDFGGALATHVGTVADQDAPEPAAAPPSAEVNVGDFTWLVFPTLVGLSTMVGTVGEEGPNIDPSTATVTGLTPAAGVLPGPWPVQVNGTGFTQTTKVLVDGVEVATTYVSATQVTTSLSATAAGTLNVGVQNYGEDPSGTTPFAVTAV